MNKRLGDRKGITLVALVITVIILLILAGIAISVLGGENGLFAKAKQAKEKYDIAEAKEKIELAIAGLRIEEEGKGEELTKEDLPKINNDEMDVRDTTSFPVEVICGIYKFEVDENFVVTYVGEADGTIITYTTEPEGYTNKDEIKILIKVRNPKGIKTIEYPNGDKVEIGGATEREADYTVTVNGTYIFKVIDSDNKEITKDIEVDKIDKLEPIDFTPEIKKEGNSITIIENGEDAEADEINTKSGIDYYEYYLKDENKNTTKYDTNKIENLEIGTYQVYVIVYDKAGNSKKSSEMEIKIMVPFKEISAGEDHTLAIDENGSLWAWGHNEYLKLGNEKITNSTIKIPTLIKDGKKFKEISAGGDHTLAIDENNNLFAWGSNNYYQIKITGNRKYKKIAAGSNFSLAIDESGNLWGMGMDDSGQLGINSLGNTKYSSLIQINKGTKYKEISAGKNYALAIDEDNNLWAWGSNLYKQLGIGTKISDRNNAIKIDNGMKYKKIAAGYDFSLAIDENGNLWGCGRNRYGQLGSEVGEDSNIWVKVMKDKKFKEVSVGTGHVLLLDMENHLYTCGRNDYGQLGNRTTENSSILIQIKPEIKFSKITAGDFYGLAIDESKNTWAWGSNSYGQLGNETQGKSLVPIKIN